MSVSGWSTIRASMVKQAKRQPFSGKLVEDRRSTFWQQKLSVGRDSKILPKSEEKGVVPVAAPRTHVSVERVGQTDIAALFRQRDQRKGCEEINQLEERTPKRARRAQEHVRVSERARPLIE